MNGWRLQMLRVLRWMLRYKAGMRLVMIRWFAVGVGMAVIAYMGSAALMGKTTTAKRQGQAQGQAQDLKASLTNARWDVIPTGKTSDTASGGVTGKRPRSSGLVVVPPGSRNGPALAAGRLSQIRSMSTRRLVARLAPNRGNGRAERTAVFNELDTRGLFIYDRRTGKLYFAPMKPATKRAAPGSAGTGRPRTGQPRRSDAARVRTEGARIRVLAAGPNGWQPAPAPVTGFRLAIPNPFNPKTFVFVQLGANGEVVSASVGAGVGTPTSTIGQFSPNPTGVNARGELTVQVPNLGTVSGKASVNFNPVTREFSGGGSGTISTQGPNGTRSQTVSFSVSPTGEISVKTSDGRTVDLGDQKLTVTAPSQNPDGTQNPGSITVSPSGPQQPGAGQNQGFKVVGKLEADVTANVPVPSFLGGRSEQQQAPGQTSPGDRANSPEVGGRDADRQAPAEPAPGDEQAPGQTSPGDRANSPEVGGRDADRQAPAGDQGPPADEGPPVADAGGAGGDFGSRFGGGGDFGADAPGGTAVGGGDFRGGGGDFGGGGATGDFGGGGSGGGGFSGGGGDSGGGGATGDFGGGDVGGGDIGGGDIGGGDIGGGDFGGGF